MKKLLFGLIATVIFSTISFSQSVIPYSEYGFYHNEALALIDSDMSEWIKMDSNEKLDYMNVLLAKKYPQKFSNVDLTKAKKLFAGYQSNKFGYDGFLVLWNSNKQNLYNSENLPKRICLLLDKMTSNTLSSDQVLNEITINKNSKDLTEQEMNCLIVMESVLKSSTSYWNDNSGTIASRRDCWIADVALSLIFVESGPLSIIAGAFGSQVCENTNKT